MNSSEQYKAYLDIAEKADKAASYLEQDMITIDQAPVEPLLMLLEKLCSSGLAPAQELECLLKLFQRILPAGNLSDVAILIRMTSSRIREAILRHEDVIAHRALVSEINYLHNTARISDHYHGNVPEYCVPFTGKGVVYSCITGGYDDIKDPEFITEGLDYVIFSDDTSVRSDRWDVRLISNPDNLSPGMLARNVKLFPWNYLYDYDYSIWIDGKIQPIADTNEYIRTYARSESMLCFNHYEARGITDEARHITEMRKASPDVIEAQLNSYISKGYPQNINAVDTCVLVRSHHDDKLRNVMADWWNEIRQWSIRDQMSFGYCCWKNDFVYDTSPLYVYENPFFCSYAHN